MLSPIRFLTAVAALALAVSACGGSSSPRHTTNQTPAGRDFASDASRFATCMRTHGVPGYPDPSVTSSGNEVSIRITPGTANPNSPAFAGANQDCHGFLPGGGTPAPSQQQASAHLRDLVAFAQCMRHRGVGNFPDPTAQGQLSVQMVQSAGVDLQSRGIDADAYACSPASHGVLTRADIARSLRDAASQ